MCMVSLLIVLFIFFTFYRLDLNDVVFILGVRNKYLQIGDQALNRKFTKGIASSVVGYVSTSIYAIRIIRCS